MRGTKSEMRPGVWRLRVHAGRRPNGSPIQITKTLDTTGGKPAKPGSGSRAADAELAKMVAKVDGGVSGGPTTVDALLDRFLVHSAMQGRSPTTLRKYHQIADAVIRPAIGTVTLSKLTAQHLDALYATLVTKGNKSTTVRRVHALIGAALHQAMRWDLVERDVSRRASPPAVHASPVRAPSPGDVRTLIAAAEDVEPMMATLLVMAALTGARRGELCALRWSDLDRQGATLTIARSLYELEGGGWAEKATRTHAGRRIGLDDLALEVLRRHRGNVDALAEDLGVEIAEDAFMFSRSPSGLEPIMPTVVTHFVARVSKKAGVPIGDCPPVARARFPRRLRAFSAIREQPARRRRGPKGRSCRSTCTGCRAPCQHHGSSRAAPAPLSRLFVASRVSATAGRELMLDPGTILLSLHVTNGGPWPRQLPRDAGSPSTGHVFVPRGCDPSRSGCQTSERRNSRRRRTARREQSLRVSTALTTRPSLTRCRSGPRSEARRDLDRCRRQ